MDVVERRNGRLYLIGLAASLVGNSAMTLVAGIWVKSLTGSSAQASGIRIPSNAIPDPSAQSRIPRGSEPAWNQPATAAATITKLAIVASRCSGSAP